ncbi:hypothetical protein TCE0_034r10284 [Talaromyces pinophilus]|uniref:SET domain-containing protein n=1 Tax=Talaromyces pinophilus TaxID=128442 RepID=A0A6V8HD59_TALPI|nr:hypothetical protein TCE0_034r10284 [Talaromyces pinophilus]
MADDHPYLDLPIPKYAPIELRPTPGKGWGVFATRDIKRGSLIMKERAMFIIQKQSGNITEQDVYEAVERLSDSQMHIIACLSDNRPRELSNGMMDSGPLALAQIWGKNCFSLESGVEGRPFGDYVEQKRWGLFPCHSRFNHSCQPNAGVPESPESPSESQVGRNSTSSYAERDIAAGEEITISYKNGFRSRTLDERHRLLEFECSCTVCDRASKDPTFRQVSDLRRRLIRGLIYLLDGIDENSEYDDDDSHSRPVICDPIMRKAADNCDFPLSARLIYDLLLAVLTEAEGLLDIETAANTWTHVWRRACSFGTEENRKIAKLAVQQKTWIERLGMAFQLDGRADAADYWHTLAYRQVKGIKI